MIDGGSIQPSDFEGSLIDNNGQLSGVLHTTLPCFGSYAADIPYTGTLDSENTLSITSSPVNGEVLKINGTLSGNTALTNTVFTVTGACTESLDVTFISSSGVRVPNLSAAWTSVGAPF